MENDLTLRSVAEAGHTADIPLIERAWGHPDPELRRTALGSFNRAGELKYLHLLTAFRDVSFTVRRRASELSPRMKIDPTERDQLIDCLAHCLDDVDEVAEMAAFALGEIGSVGLDTDDTDLDDTDDTDDAADTDLDDTDDLDESASEEPVASLPAAVIEKLEHQALKHSDALCREQAVASLGALHSSKSVILEALNDKATVRRRAVIALAPFDGEDVDAALNHALDDRDWQVRQAAEDLLAD